VVNNFGFNHLKKKTGAIFPQLDLCLIVRLISGKITDGDLAMKTLAACPSRNFYTINFNQNFIT